jgi:hypothetical protein
VQPQNEGKVPTFIAKISSRSPVNPYTNTLIFDISGDPKETQNMPKMFYKDLKMVARHYRVSEIGRHKVQRHYTVANCMEPKVLAKYLAALRGETLKKEDFT